jgi:hypothetical protein
MADIRDRSQCIPCVICGKDTDPEWISSLSIKIPPIVSFSTGQNGQHSITVKVLKLGFTFDPALDWILIKDTVTSQ